METPNLFDKACVFSGIQSASIVYVDHKYDKAVKPPLMGVYYATLSRRLNRRGEERMHHCRDLTFNS